MLNLRASQKSDDTVLAVNLMISDPFPPELPSLEHYAWLVRARARNQELLLRLYQFSRLNEDAIQRNATGRLVFGWLVGAAFSLWRAAFLGDVRRSWPDILSDANGILEILVQDNAVNYQQDRKTRAWMAGYYLNNARFRIARTRDSLAGSNENIDLSQLDSLDARGIADLDPKEVWEILHDALVQVLTQVEAAILQAPSV